MSDFTRVEVPAQETGPNAPESTDSGAQGQDSSRPEWLPPKFNSPEDLAKAYAELEKKLGAGGSENPEQQQAGQSSNNDNQNKTSGNFNQSQAQAAEQLTKKGLDFGEFQQEYLEKGGLSDDSYAKLEQAGFSRDFVDSWIAGQEALAAQMQNKVFESIGGEQNYEAMVQWAMQNLSPDEIAAFNQTVESGSLASAKMAVSGLFARYQDSVGNEPNLLPGENATSVQGFRSQAEMVAAMRDTRYRNDPAYRDEVARKVAAATFF